MSQTNCNRHSWADGEDYTVPSTSRAVGSQASCAWRKWATRAAGLIFCGAFAALCIGVVLWRSHLKQTSLQQFAEDQAPSVLLEATQSCERVVRLLQQLPDSADGIRHLTARIAEERTLLERLASGLRLAGSKTTGRLGVAYADLNLQRKTLEQRVNRFNEAMIIAPAPNAASLKDLQPRRIVHGPGKSLVEIVDRYAQDVQKLLKSARLIA